MLEIHLATQAFARGKRFFGLRKVDRYVTGAETAWLHNCSKLLGDGRVTSAVIAVGEQYILGDNPPITDSADEVAAMIYTQDLVVRWRQTLAET